MKYDFFNIKILGSRATESITFTVFLTLQIMFSNSDRGQTEAPRQLCDTVRCGENIPGTYQSASALVQSARPPLLLVPKVNQPGVLPKVSILPSNYSFTQRISTRILL